MDKLDPTGSGFLDSIINNHETNTKGRQQTFDYIASKTELSAPRSAKGYRGMLDTRNLDDYEKYSGKFTGPSPVLAKKWCRAQELQVPDSWKIHDVFHHMLVSPYIEDQDPTRQQVIRKRIPTLEPQETQPGAVPNTTIEPPLSSL